MQRHKCQTLHGSKVIMLVVVRYDFDDALLKQSFATGEPVLIRLS